MNSAGTLLAQELANINFHYMEGQFQLFLLNTFEVTGDFWSYG